MHALQDKQYSLKSKILDCAKDNVQRFDWSNELPEVASAQAGLDKSLGRILFPAGMIDLIGFFLECIDSEMIKVYNSKETANLRTHEKIKKCLSIRVSIMIQNKDLFQKTIPKLLEPALSLHGLKYLWRTVDVIWREAGIDNSTDFNFYTKRSLLAGVYTLILIRWLYGNQNVEQLIDQALRVPSMIKKARDKLFFC